MYQRPPQPEEVKLGLQFLAEKPEPEKVASADDAVKMASNDFEQRKRQKEKQLARQKMGKRGDNFKKREPLKAWEEYTHALLQANEASFVN